MMLIIGETGLYSMNKITTTLKLYQQGITTVMNAYQQRVFVRMNDSNSIELSIHENAHRACQKSSPVERIMNEIDPTWKDSYISTGPLQESFVTLLYACARNEHNVLQKAIMMHYESSEYNFENHMATLHEQIERLKKSANHLNYAHFITIFPVGGPRLLFNDEDKARCQQQNKSLQELVQRSLAVERIKTTPKPYYIPMTCDSPIKICVNLNDENSSWEIMYKLVSSCYTERYFFYEEVKS